MNALYESEAAVLGALVSNGQLMEECVLTPEDFITDPRHPLIMEYLKYTWDEDGVIDLLLMAKRSGEKLQRIGGFEYLFKLRDVVPSESNFHFYQKIVRNAYITRKTNEYMNAIAEASKQDDADAAKLIFEAKTALDELSELSIRDKEKGLKHISVYMEGHAEKLMERKKQRGITGSKTVSPRMDKMIGGHQKGDLDIYAARPSMGKTALIINEMLTAARAGTTVAFYSLEMSGPLIIDRFLCCLANIENSKMRTGDFDESDWERYSYAVDEFLELPIYIDDTPGIKLQEIRKETKALVKERHNVVVYVDYLQLVNPGKSFKEPRDGVKYVSAGLKSIARTLEVAMVAISAVGRDCEKRVDKRPMMSDLRDSGSIESDADVLVFLYRDEYYDSESEKKGIVELIIAKGRNVGVGKVEMAFLKQYGKFKDLDYDHQPKGAYNGKKVT